MQSEPPAEPRGAERAGRTRAGDELVVMTWAGGWGRALREAVSLPFEARTGIRVRHELHVGLKLPERLLRALARGERPPFDVVWSNGVPAMREAEAGFAQPLDPDEVPRLAELHPRARPEAPASAGSRASAATRAAAASGADWPLVLPYVVHYVLAYRESAVAKPPESWDVLLDPRHRGRIALYPGGNGFHPIAQVMGGGFVDDIPRDMEACWRFLRRLAPQIGKLDYSIGMGERIRRGELDLCFRALTNALEFRREGLDVAWAAPAEGVADTQDALWIPRGVPADAAARARRYVDFACSRDVQARWCELLGVMPLHPGAPLPETLRACPALPRDPDDRTGVLFVPERVKLEHERDWEAQFAAILG